MHVLEAEVSQLRDHRVVVVGDIMVDQYVRGEVSRISPEAPVPVLEVRAREDRLGGAANVAANIRALGGAAALLGVVGADDAGQRIQHRLQQLDIRTSLVVDARRPTTIKTRVVARGQQIVRIDEEQRQPIDSALVGELLRHVETQLEGASACVVSDYAKGVVTEELAQGVIRLARERGVPVVVDPKRRDFRAYRGASVITPTIAELDRALEVPMPASTAGEVSEGALAAAAAALAPQLGGAALLVTRSADGMTLFRAGARPVHVPALAKEVYDVTGAGDTVVATLTLALAAGMSLEHAIELASVAAAISVSKRGTSTVSPDELAHGIHSTKGR